MSRNLGNRSFLFTSFFHIISTLFFFPSLSIFFTHFLHSTISKNTHHTFTRSFFATLLSLVLLISTFSFYCYYNNQPWAAQVLKVSTTAQVHTVHNNTNNSTNNSSSTLSTSLLQPCPKDGTHILITLYSTLDVCIYSSHSLFIPLSSSCPSSCSPHYFLFKQK